MKTLVPSEGMGYELPVIQDVEAYSIEGGASLKFNVISSDLQIAAVYAKLKAEQAVALIRGTKVALRPEVEEDDGSHGRVVVGLRSVRRAAESSKPQAIHVVVETESGPLTIKMSEMDAAELAAQLDFQSLRRTQR